MSHRHLASAIASVIVAALLLHVPLGGQTAPASAKTKAAAKRWTPPRTPDGYPDLQGFWTNSSNVPLQRPENLGSKKFYTEQEAGEILRRGYPGDHADIPEAHYDLSQFGLDPSQAKFPSDLRTSLIVGQEGRIPPMKVEAQEREADRAAKNKGHEFDGPENRSLSERCIMWPAQGPPMLPVPINANYLQVVQGPGYVSILQEMIHDVRIIPTDGRPHLPTGMIQWRGDSVGHWEGNTLVVDVTNFNGRAAFFFGGIGVISQSLHVVERFTRTADDAILYEFTVDDPATWTKPWSAQMPWAKSEGPIYEYACHEANHGLMNTLRGARVGEAEAAK